MAAKETVACIVPSAGKGRRLDLSREKPFLKLKGKPLLFHTLRALASSPFIDYIIAVVSGEKVKTCRALVKKYHLRKIRAVVPGGKRRADSVEKGLREAGDADFILVHDGARPFIDKDLIKKVLFAAKKEGAALAAIPSKQTLKSVENSFVMGTPDRKRLWEAQTPQGFEKNLIVEAYKRADKRGVTDDSMLAERLGCRVKIVRGSSRNIKITTPEDLKLARIICE